MKKQLIQGSEIFLQFTVGKYSKDELIATLPYNLPVFINHESEGRVWIFDELTQKYYWTYAKNVQDI